MAVLYITECNYTGHQSGDAIQVALLAPVAEQTLAIGGASAASTAFSANTNFIRVCADTTCAVAVGATPTAQVAAGTLAPAAAVGTLRIPANVPEYFWVAAGQKIATIATT